MSDSDWSIDPEDEPREPIHAQQPPGYEEHEEQSPVGMYGNQMGADPEHAPRTSNYATVIPRLHGQVSGLRATRPREETPPQRNVHARTDSQETVTISDDTFSSSATEPATDLEAFHVFMPLEKNSWKSTGNAFFCYNNDTGTWSTDKDRGVATMRHLIARHVDVLGKYSHCVRCIDQVLKFCKGKNLVDADWFNKLNTRFEIGEMAFRNGVYNILTGVKKPLSADSLVQRQLAYPAPDRPATPRVKNEVRRIINQLFPEENSRIEIMKRYAETGFTTTNKDKYIVQLYGDGDNGKSTLAAISKKVFAEYNETVVGHSLDAGTKTGEINTWAIKFHGARWVWQDEGTCDGVLDSCKLKKIRGGSGLSGRVPYGPLIDVVPTWKL